MITFTNLRKFFETKPAKPTLPQHLTTEGGRMVYRKHDWLDTKTMQPMHGIQAKSVGFEARWFYCAEKGKPLLFKTEEERNAKLKELRASQLRGALAAMKATAGSEGRRTPGRRAT